MYTAEHKLEPSMTSTTFTVRIEDDVKERLKWLAESTGRSEENLAADAIAELLHVNDWQVAGIKAAIASMERGEGIPHTDVKAWVASLGTDKELPPPGSDRG